MFFDMNEMDNELKAKLHKQFMDEMERIAKIAKSDDVTTDFNVGSWLFGFLPQFIEDVYKVGKEVGELEGRLKGYEKGVEDEIERQKKALDELSKMN